MQFWFLKKRKAKQRKEMAKWIFPGQIHSIGYAMWGFS
jgi:hypothetical protein